MRQKIDYLLERLLIILMSILVLDVLWQVCSRYLLNSPSSFTDEMAGFLLIWVGLMGAAYVSGKNEHLAIDFFAKKLSEKRQRIIQYGIQIAIIFFAISTLIIGGSWLVYTRFYLSVKSSSLSIPLGFVYLVLPISGLLILYYATSDILRLKNNSHSNK
ncbi:MAG TPA: TRAP transporter small permease [Saprospiraceae bacterium]|nr:TRAP transporter small permease [Saprospiraceae bacterium]